MGNTCSGIDVSTPAGEKPEFRLLGRKAPP
jgi:hypothetical protein